MSTLAENVTRIANAKTAIKNAINLKGGTLTTELIGSYADAVAALPSGGSFLYRCASVNAGARTWTGYKAVQDSTSKAWSFESSLTSDVLTIEGDVPVVGKVYNANATAAVSFFPDGLIFYAPLTASSATAATGQALTATGTIDYSSGYAFFDGSYLTFPDTGFPTDYSGRTISAILKKASGSGWQHAFGYGQGSTNAKFYLGVNNNGCAFTQCGTETNTYQSASSWVHFLVTQDGYNGQTLYINGVQNTTSYLDVYTTLDIGYIGAGIGLDSSEMFHGYIGECKIWNRVLTQAEITAEYNRVHTWS